MANYERFNLGLEENPKPNRKNEKEEDSSRKLTRRDFLKMAAVAGITIGASPGFQKILDRFFAEEEGDNKEGKDVSEEKDTQSHAESEFPKEEEEKNIKSIKEIIDFNQEGKIELNSETAEALKNYWKEKYNDSSELKPSLEHALEKMAPWDEYLKREFQETKVPEKFRFLLIPESHGKWGARSGVGAVGPYQFMPRTGRSYGLESSYYRDCHPNLEERQDPVKSARACAQLLRDLYDKGGKDWDLALSGYNGGFYWRYLKQAHKQKEKINYEGFLKYLETEINFIRDSKQEKITAFQEQLNSEKQIYEVKSGDTLRKIAMRYRVNVDKLREVNNLADPNKIQPGQKLEIPVVKKFKEKIRQIEDAFKEKTEEEFWQEISGFSENLNYPPKFNAVQEIIAEGKVEMPKESLKYEVYRVPERQGNKIHYFKREDKSVWSIAQKEGINVKDLLEANGPNFNPNSLGEGDKIIIPGQNLGTTLEKIAQEKNKPLEDLTKLNPAIINPREEIPPGYEIRV